MQDVQETIEEQVRTVVDSLTSLGVGLTQLVIVILLARFLHKFVRDWVLGALDSPNLSEGSRSTINVISTVVVGLVAGTLLLGLWGVTWSGIVAAISLGTLGILLGIQDVLKSLIGGVFVIIERPYAIGDRIQVRDITGRIVGIELRTTVLRSDDGHRIVAPNSIVFTDTITNYSLQRHIRTTLVITGLAGTESELRAGFEADFAGLEGIQGKPEVRFRPPRGNLRSFVRRRLGDEPATGRAVSLDTETWVSWTGGGQAEVEAAVLDRILGRFPQAQIKISKQGREGEHESSPVVPE